MWPERRVNQIGKILKTGHELRMTTQIGDYDMGYIILDLGFYVNILARKTRESMGNTRLVWYPIQLILANHSKVLLICRLTKVPVEIEGLDAYAYFEVIDIVDDTNLYLVLLVE